MSTPASEFRQHFLRQYGAKAAPGIVAGELAELQQRVQQMTAVVRALQPPPRAGSTTTVAFAEKWLPWMTPEAKAFFRSRLLGQG